jgi:uncharacterized protein YfaT (DUF1175 family)
VKELKPGDMAILNQSDGNRLMIIVGGDCIIVKADRVGTKLQITPINNFSIEAKAVDTE